MALKGGKILQYQRYSESASFVCDTVIRSREVDFSGLR
jgi:hypothetical protein